MKAPPNSLSRTPSTAARPPSFIYVVVLAIVAFALGSVYAHRPPGAW